jgi:hypothetical protein
VRFQPVECQFPVPASSGIRSELQGKIAARRGIAADVRTEKSDLLLHAEVVIAELVPEAGTVALLGAGLG